MSDNQELNEDQVDQQQQEVKKTPFDYLNDKNYDELKKYVRFNKRDNEGRTLLHLAVLNNDLQAVKILRLYLSNYRDYYNKTALYYALQNKQKDIYDALKQYETLI